MTGPRGGVYSPDMPTKRIELFYDGRFLIPYHGLDLDLPYETSINVEVDVSELRVGLKEVPPDLDRVGGDGPDADCVPEVAEWDKDAALEHLEQDAENQSHISDRAWTRDAMYADDDEQWKY